MPFLSVKELEAKSLEKAKVNHATYKHIYEMCANQIRRQHGTGNECTVYTVPSFIIGRTPYTHAHAIRYTVEKLERGGFRVTQADDLPGVLAIEWSKKKKKKPEKPRTVSKKKSTPKPQKKIEEPLSVRLARLKSTSIMNA